MSKPFVFVASTFWDEPSVNAADVFRATLDTLTTDAGWPKGALAEVTMGQVIRDLLPARLDLSFGNLIVGNPGRPGCVRISPIGYDDPVVFVQAVEVNYDWMYGDRVEESA